MQSVLIVIPTDLGEILGKRCAAHGFTMEQDIIELVRRGLYVGKGKPAKRIWP